MFRSKIRTALAVLTALTALAALALPATALANPTNVTEWYLPQTNDPGLNNNAPDANVPTALDNPYQPAPNGGQSAYGQEDDSQYGLGGPPELLGYGYQELGVNLTWDAVEPAGDFNPTQGGEWEFIREPGRYVTQQIAASEHIALYDTTSGRYLAEGHQTFGIGLVWSSTPRYEWQVAKGGFPGYAGLADLYNDTEKAYLIDHVRLFGVSLGWIHAPFYTTPGYIPPRLPVSRQPVIASPGPLPVKYP